MIKPKTAGRIQPIPREKKGRKSLAKLIITDMKVIILAGLIGFFIGFFIGALSLGITLIGQNNGKKSNYFTFFPILLFLSRFRAAAAA